MGRPAVKKDLIEYAAVELFATKGLTGTSVRDIALKAGVAEGALYRHWEGKDDLGHEIYCRYVGQFALDLEAHLLMIKGDLRTRIKAGVDFLYGFYAKSPTKLAFILLTENGFPQEKAIEARKNPFDKIIHFVTFETRRGNIKPGNPVLLAAMIIGAVIRPLISHWYGRIADDPLDLVDEVVESVLAMLTPPANDANRDEAAI